MPRFTFLLSFGVSLTSALPALAQSQAPLPKPQTARQALIEIVTKGGEAAQKHLTVEVQSLLRGNAKSSASAMAILGSMKPESALQAFETGDVLFAYEEPDQHAKYEIRVDSDDLAGEEDSLQLSIHLLRDGKEQEEGIGLMSAHLTVTMRLQENIWRVDRISVGTEFPVGDPKFFAKTFLNSELGGGGMAGVHLARDDSSAEAPVSMSPDQMVRLLAVSETTFAQLHPETGFTCSLSDLTEAAKIMRIDPKVATGTYNGYRFGLSGCDGKPIGSFQLVAEPLVPAPQAKAYCTDATQNLRAAEDGRAATCVASGKPVALEPVGGVGFYSAVNNSKQ